ncbi:hypothetical protein IMZ08_13560 [Bacillus luteolus]|uniref:Uncharacterized protein n=1 Tax=Litchfieldia luteola TaxID=682179 RepID=A0ABR9QL01_9BACI|nr:hypothetical protein [Cytobacillus luteolus]MBE4909091.1 hypothetical protein [Cytobacillus luteolus]MBP1941947.1 hypothetical protein [Cytobacillus luteolus]
MESKLNKLKEDYQSSFSSRPVFTEKDKMRIRSRIENGTIPNKFSGTHFFPRMMTAFVLVALFAFAVGIAGERLGLFDSLGPANDIKTPVGEETEREGEVEEQPIELTESDKITEALQREGLPLVGNNIFDPKSVKPGDQVAGWRLIEIEAIPGSLEYPYDTTKAYFEGKATITGTIELVSETNELFGGMVTFTVDEESTHLLPISHHDTRKKWLIFENQEEAKEILQLSSGETLEGVKVTLANYSVQYVPSDVTDFATLISFDGASSFELISPELEKVYQRFRTDFNEEALIGLSPLDIFKLYYYAASIEDYRTQYELFIFDEEYIRVFETYEDYLQAVNETREASSNLLEMISKSNLMEVILPDDENAAITVGDLEGTSFGLVKNKKGIWKVQWLPLQ